MRSWCSLYAKSTSWKLVLFACCRVKPIEKRSVPCTLLMSEWCLYRLCIYVTLKNKAEKNKVCVDKWCQYLWRGSEVDDALQLHLVSKLLHQEGVPVLVDCPLCRVYTVQLKHVQGKDVSDRTESRVQVPTNKTVKNTFLYCSIFVLLCLDFTILIYQSDTVIPSVSDSWAAVEDK